jgi:hypothetical protein
MLEPILTEEINGPLQPFTFIGGWGSDNQPQFEIEENDICLN